MDTHRSNELLDHISASIRGTHAGWEGKTKGEALAGLQR